ncbi:MAG: hypothetical protein EOP50_22500, partial [Sphingobacteriales bacterium]
MGKLAFLMLMTGFAATSQTTTVFSDDFSTSAGTSYTTSATAIGTSTKWSFVRGGGDLGAKIDGGRMAITNDATAATNSSNYGMAYANMAAFASPFTTTLGSNPGLVTWTFNMRQQRSNPAGFTSGIYGAAFILAGTSGTTNSVGTGYAVILGNSGRIDPVKLIRYNAGLNSQTVITQSTGTGFTDFGNQYLSIKVTYAPATNTWSLYMRNDGSTGFADPETGTLTFMGSGTNNSSTTSSLLNMGSYWNAATNASQLLQTDNVKVTVAVPATTSLSPSSKIANTGAFTLTVNGSNFTMGSVVRWNGSARTTTFVSATQVTAA